MKQDWKALAMVTMDHLGGTIGTTAGTMGIGLLAGIALVVLFWKLGVFRRPTHVWYGRAVKLYVPYLLAVCVYIGAQSGLYRSVRNAALEANDAAMAALYAEVLAPALGTEEARQAFLLSVQQQARNTQDLGKAITGAVKDVLHGPPSKDRSLSSTGAMMLADWVIDRYENDIAAAVLYGIYLKTSGYLEIHKTGEPMDYSEFKDGVETLLKVDIVQMEATVKGNLGAVTRGVIESQYKGVLKGTLLMGLLLVLIPLVEWAIYSVVMRRKKAVASVDGAGPGGNGGASI